LDIIEHHFEQGVITPEFVQKEQEKIEIWRQEITSQSQDLTRRQLEIETRREQLEELEKKLAE
jgi:small-conductance mechanosensitive channel